MSVKKIGVLLLCALLAVALLSACDNNTTATPTPTQTPTPTPTTTPTPDGGGGTPAPQGDNFSGIDFSNENFSFLDLYIKPADSSQDGSLELTQYNGKNAIKVTPGSKNPYVVIDASSLLGARVSDLYTMEVEMAVERQDGTFEAVSGEILAYSDVDRHESKDYWSIYLENKNPNFARMTLEKTENRFVPDAYNFFILNRKTDNALEAGLEPGILYITRIGFLDEGGQYLPVDENAGLNLPEGFNEVKTHIVELGEMNISNSDSQMGWVTNGVDGVESPYTADQFANALTLVLEFAQAPTGGMQIIWQGDGDGWAWDQSDGVIPDGGLSETTLTVDLSNTLINYDKFRQSKQIKFYLGYYNDGVADLGITRAYFVVEGGNTTNVELGEMNAVNSETQMGWLTDGVDGNESPITADVMSKAVSLVLEFAQPPTGGMQLIWQGDGDGYAWNETSGVIPDEGMSETSLTIDLVSSLKNYEKFTQSTQIKLYLGYYSKNIADLGITNAYLVVEND